MTFKDTWQIQLKGWEIEEVIYVNRWWVQDNPNCMEKNNTKQKLSVMSHFLHNNAETYRSYCLITRCSIQLRYACQSRYEKFSNTRTWKPFLQHRSAFE